MESNNLPPPQSDKAAEAGLRLLAKLFDDPGRFLDSAAVGLALSNDPENSDPKAVATSARKRGLMFGVWTGAKYLYPAFQFDHHGTLRPDVPALVNALPRDRDGGFRDAALWVFSPDAAFGGLTPAEIFPVNPALVISVARLRLEGPD